MRIKRRHIFFAIHFGVGFLMLWLTYQLIHDSLLPTDHSSLKLQATLETSYLVAGVVWGNVGWDTFKQIPNDAGISLLTYVLSRTLAPVAIALPVGLVLLDMFFQGKYLTWRLAVTWQNITILALSIIVLVLLFFYRRSEKGYFYRAWRA